MELGKSLPVSSAKSIGPMDRLRETIHENEFLNYMAHRIRFYTMQFFLGQAHLNTHHKI